MHENWFVDGKTHFGSGVQACVKGKRASNEKVSVAVLAHTAVLKAPIRVSRGRQMTLLDAV